MSTKLLALSGIAVVVIAGLVFTFSGGVHSLAGFSQRLLAAVTGAEQADLSATFTAPTSAIVGTPVTFSGTITNSGTKTTGSTFLVRFFIDNDTDHTNTPPIPSARPGSESILLPGASFTSTATATYTFPASPNSTTWYVQACADMNADRNQASATNVARPGGIIPESNEENNCGVWTAITVASLTSTPLAPPAGVTGSCNTAGTQATVSWSPVEGATGYYVRVIHPAGQACPTGWTAAPWNPTAVCFPASGDGTATSPTTYPTIPGGTYSAYVHSNYSGVSSPPTSSSNFSCVTASSPTPPTTSCTFNGQTVLDSRPITAYLAASVPSGQTCTSQVRTCTNGVLSGTYQYATCTVASTGTLPDLTASAITSTTTVRVNTEVRLSGVVSNIGDVGAYLNYISPNYFFIDDNADHTGTIPYFAVGSTGGTLLSGANFTTVGPYTFPAVGTWYVRMCVDANATMQGVVTESNETNNCGAWTAVTVTATSSAPPTLSVTPTNGTLPLIVSITATANNDKVCSTQHFGVRFDDGSEPSYFRTGSPCQPVTHTVHHVFATEGEHIISLWSFDSELLRTTTTVTRPSGGLFVPTLTANPSTSIVNAGKELLVELTAIVNTDNSCAEGKFVVFFGDGTPGHNFTVPINTCKPKVVTVTHRYDLVNAPLANTPSLWKRDASGVATTELARTNADTILTRPIPDLAPAPGYLILSNMFTNFVARIRVPIAGSEYVPLVSRSVFPNTLFLDNNSDHTGTIPYAVPLTWDLVRDYVGEFVFPTAGPWYARLCADTDPSMKGIITESNENNNCLPWMLFTVSQKTDGTAETFGAIGDGIADDTVALQKALDSGAPVTLGNGKTYKISSTLTVPSNSGILAVVGDVPPKIIMSSALGAFSNVSALTLEQNGKNAVGILVNNVSNVTLSGFSLVKEYDKTHYVRSITIFGSKDITLDKLVLSGISRGKSLIKINSSSFVKITNSTIGNSRIEVFDSTRGKFTDGLVGISIDTGVALGGAYSNNITISKNKIENLTVSPQHLAAGYGMETYGISVSATQTSRVIISDNSIWRVGDGIEFFGLSGLISGNTIEDAYRYGVTLHNGASDNVVENNKIKWAGKVGVRIAGPTPYYSFDAVATFWPAGVGSATSFVPGGGWSGQMYGASFQPAPGVNAMGNIIRNNTITETGGGTLGQAGLWSVNQFTSGIALEGSIALTATGAARGNLVYGNTVDNGVMNSATKYAKHSFYCGSAFGDVLPGVHRNVYGVNTFGEAAVKTISTSNNCAIYGDVTTFPQFAKDSLLSDFYLDVFKLPI